MINRSVAPLLQEALSISPVVLLTGARQVGKSTLCIDQPNEYRIFDDLGERESAFSDPVGYISGLPKPITLDEIQKVPELLEPIKKNIDLDRINGHFLLTGSANVLDMKAARDTLAGRIIELVLWPLSQKELNSKSSENIIDLLFEGDFFKLKFSRVSQNKLLEAILLGGYPEIQKIKTTRGRGLWFNSYISTYVERDIRDVGELRDITAFIRFFNIIVPRSSSLLNKSDLANDASLSEASVSNYLSMLEMIFQISTIKAYSSNVSKRFIKSPKIFLNDSGVLCHILGITTTAQLYDSSHKGDIIETFVASELQKHMSYSTNFPKLFHYRTNDKKEIDFILENGEMIVAIEVKSSQSIKRDAFKHIIDFQKKSPKKVVGIIFYAGDVVLPFGDDQFQRYALPLATLF